MKKLLALLILSALIYSFGQNISNYLNQAYDGLSVFNEDIDEVNATFSALISSKVKQPANSTLNSNSSKIVYFWDILPASARLALLSQLDVVKQWNVADAVQKNQTNLTWSSLRIDVQFSLLSKNINLINQTFYQWGWVKSLKEHNANSTLFTIFKRSARNRLPEIITYLQQITLNTLLDVDVLESFDSIELIYLSRSSAFFMEEEKQDCRIQKFFRNLNHIFIPKFPERSWWESERRESPLELYYRIERKYSGLTKSIYSWC